ncbi:MAG: hypothetical protein JWM59_4679 [Verrucomicrobiales bacterium]|nr:hypothetical protein [Verrucomicrobiales bacterium]
MTNNMDFDQLRAFVAADEETRRRRVSPVEILDYRSEDERGPRLAAPGSITVYIGRRGDERLRQLREIAAGGSDDGSFAAALCEQRADRHPQNPGEIHETLRSAGVYATIRCGPRHLAAHICLPRPTIWPSSHARTMVAGFPPTS